MRRKEKEKIRRKEKREVEEKKKLTSVLL